MAKFRATKAEKQKAALKHVQHLLAEAEKAYKENPEYSHDYASQAFKAATRVNLRLPSELKRRICRNCNHFLVPGSNLQVRNTAHRMVFTCLDCGNISRFGYVKEQKEKRVK